MNKDYTYQSPNRFHINKNVCLLVLVILTSLSSCLTSKLPQEKPTVFLIGDSTVKNGKGKGDGGLWGWGSFIYSHFDTMKISVENHALGGTSSRTFRTQGHWDKVLPKVKAGDYVLMQFGHNDSSPVNDISRARGTLRSNGEETEAIENMLTKKPEVVHSYGWYLRQYIKEVKAKGATPVVLSPIPRNSWKAGNVNRSDKDFGKWAEAAAQQEGVVFINLNKLVADRYDAEGEAKVRSAYFNTVDSTHPIEAGARLNAALVAMGIKEQKKLPLYKFLNRNSPKI